MLTRSLLLFLVLASPICAQDAQTDAHSPMTLDRLNDIVLALDPEAQTDGRIWHFHIADVPILIVTDFANNRMRAMSAVGDTNGIEPEELLRMLQANFDTALDARYAIANDRLWSIFLHPLRSLEKNDLISGLGQVVNLTTSYGSLYSGGALQFGGGDSGELQRKLIDDLLKKGEDI